MPVPLHRRRIRPAHIGSAGRSGSRRLGDSQRRVCQVSGGPPLVPRFTPAGNFASHRRVEQDPARGRLRFRSHSDDRAEAEPATVAVQRENEHPLDIFFLLVLGAVVLHKGPPQQAHTHAADACGDLGQPNLTEFRISIGDPRQRAVADLRWQPEQGVPNHNPGVVVGEVGELRATRDVAEAKDAPVGRAHPRIDSDSLCARLDPGGREVERLDARPTAGGDEQM